MSKGYLSIAVIATVSALAAAAESTCFGSVSKGRLEGGVALPSSGPNFTGYSTIGELVGRTYVHSVVRDVVATAFRALESAAPGKFFVFGESGWKEGGRMRPHRTHQNGLSVDFMVPVVDKSGKSVPLPTSPLNKFGYDIEFDRSAKQNLKFMRGKPWVRHDEHYHVDFAVSCKPIAG